jgi:hypothetical protein
MTEFGCRSHSRWKELTEVLVLQMKFALKHLQGKDGIE